MSIAPTNHTPAHTLEQAQAPGSLLTTTAAKALAVLRVATGFVFLWAFLDKTFGLGYSTTSAKSWIHGGSPTKGFLASVDVGPFQSAYHTIAGTWWADWLFMLGMLGVGVALIVGVGLRAAATAGTLIMTMMWFGEFPLARHTATGTPSASTNPLTDYHFIYVAVLIVLAATYAGHVWGLGRQWARLRFVQRHRWLI
ncbi:DoxX family membrane protein [Rugosimonospora africana]|uniref:Membrane protein n=1 Tax=Rugosimonospora africana TaxID=556532 RepID=A0A8J3VVW8_9ACTN|nr:DoxX family membrane protein [Rugosimonospora africana]GIH21117.1 membrane protein [Rugosimonospora africana]